MQSLTLLDPTKALNVPAAQFEHALLSLLTLYEPAGQSQHCGDPTNGLKLPAGQLKQE
jgi:hypothetical protein